jgi:hypothetical protein
MITGFRYGFGGLAQSRRQGPDGGINPGKRLTQRRRKHRHGIDILSTSDKPNIDISPP